MLLQTMLQGAVQQGCLRVIDAAGRLHRHGDGHGPAVTVRLRDRGAERGLVLNPRLGLGEAYTDGLLVVEEGSLYDLLDLAARNLASIDRLPLQWVLNAGSRLTRWWAQTNPIDRSRRNVQVHYDLPAALYGGFLDPDRHYSCAYFRHPDESLEAAQQNKCRHVAGKLLAEPGMRVLDLGCGWGGMARHLACHRGAVVTGITLSDEQLAFAASRVRADRLDNAVRIERRDWRREDGTYDRVVSLEMFEHVGVPHYDAFFAWLRDRLAQDGVAVMQVMGRMDGPAATDPWLRKHIMPGGYCPALSEMLPAIERAGFWVTDVEVWRLHYARTLALWRDRFAHNRAGVASEVGERLCRLWDYYLTGCEVAFRRGGFMVLQLQLARRIDAVPPTRDYLAG